MSALALYPSRCFTVFLRGRENIPEAGVLRFLVSLETDEMRFMRKREQA